LNEELLAIIFSTWIFTSFFCWLFNLKWIFEPKYYTVGHILFAVGTLPFSLMGICVYLLMKLFQLIGYICKIKIN